MNIDKSVSKILRGYANLRLGKKFRKEAVPGSIFLRPCVNETEFPWNSCGGGVVIVDARDDTQDENKIEFRWKDYFSVTAISIEEYEEFQKTGICNFRTAMHVTYSIIKEHYDYKGPCKDEVKKKLLEQYSIFLGRYLRSSVACPIITYDLSSFSCHNVNSWRELFPEEIEENVNFN